MIKKTILLCLLSSSFLINNNKVSADVSISKDIPANIINQEKDVKNTSFKKVYISEKNKAFKTKEDIILKKIPDYDLNTSEYYYVLNEENVLNIAYYRVSKTHEGFDSYWIASNDVLEESSFKLVEKEVASDNYTFYKTKEDVKKFTINPERLLSTNYTDEVVTSNDVLTIVKEIDVPERNVYQTWVYVDNVLTFQNEKDALETSKINKKIGEGKEAVFTVDIKGWVLKKDVKIDYKTKEIVFKTNKVTVYDSKDLSSSSYKKLDNVLNKTMGYTHLSIEKTTLPAYKLGEFKSNDLETNVFIDLENVDKGTYAKITDEVELEKSYVKVTKDTVVSSDVKHAEKYKELYKVLKEDYLTVKNKIIAEHEGTKREYYQVLEKGAVKGYIPVEDVEYLNGSKVEYTVKKDEDLESILKKFDLTKERFLEMNLSKTYVDCLDIKEGNSFYVKAPEISYNTSNVSGTSSSGISLIKEIMPTATFILESGLKPSVAYAQALLESAYGTSGLATRSNNLFGIKGTYKGQGSSWATLEDGSSGLYQINATFRTYPSIYESVFDYVDLIANNSRYASAKHLNTAEETITAIWKSGYATDTSYVSKVMSVINSYDLTQFDTF